MKQKLSTNIGLNFQNSYLSLPSVIMSKISPEPVRAPELVVFNNSFAKELDLTPSDISDENLAKIFSGNVLPKGSESVAFAYAGHQFGFFTILGDGRAVLLGEHNTKNNKKYEIQLKGSGKTPYSRQGDGRAAFGPVLREYIVSEAMYGLGIPTTRCLAVVKTGERVFREGPLPGAILTRVASSYVRVGTFQYAAAKKDTKTLRALTDYVIKKHFDGLIESKKAALDLLSLVIKKQIDLVVSWMGVGFVHGVLNTDNVAVSGETIDYGPCAFLDSYSRDAVFSSIDHTGRYSYGNQPIITHWNLLRFAEALLPLIHPDQKTAVKMASGVFENFDSEFKKRWMSMMLKKIGILDEREGDSVLLQNLLNWMQKNKSDFTNTFVFLTTGQGFGDEKFKQKDFLEWKESWEKRLFNSSKEVDYKNLMEKNNPKIIPRNNVVENVLYEATENNNTLPFLDFLKKLNNPYGSGVGKSVYQTPPKDGGLNYKTFCGT